jgi:hypothetical protein
MLAAGRDDAMARFALGFVALLMGALAVQYSKWLEVGTRQQPREDPNPYFELVRFLGALLFLGGLALIAWSAWSLMT